LLRLFLADYRATPEAGGLSQTFKRQNEIFLNLLAIGKQVYLSKRACLKCMTSLPFTWGESLKLSSKLLLRIFQSPSFLEDKISEISQDSVSLREHSFFNLI
jgi:hypothetical protein